MASLSATTITMSPTQTQEDSQNERYSKRELIGRGAFKTVYKAIDTEDALEVAWNEVRLAGVQPAQKAKILGEITILEQLQHPNIMAIYDSWETSNGDLLIFITEIMSSGTLKDFLRRAKKVSVRSIRKWCKQILEGLDYLHSHNPPIIHRDLKCDNIFMNGNRGEVKIGDLGLSICMKDKKFAVSVIGTPEFMAPELYEEMYDERIDVYAFGMCVLEMVTGEYPYSECENAAQVYRRVTAGIKPAALNNIQHKPIKDFILLCLSDKTMRPSPKELLSHPFMQHSADDSLTFVLGGSEDEGRYTVTSSGIVTTPIIPPIMPIPITPSLPSPSQGETPRVVLQSDSASTGGTVQMKLYLKIRGAYKEIKFPFNLIEDTPADVASEMVAELDLTDDDCDHIAKGIQQALSDALLTSNKVIQSEKVEINIEKPIESAGSVSPLITIETPAIKPVQVVEHQVKIETTPEPTRPVVEVPKPEIKVEVKPEVSPKPQGDIVERFEVPPQKPVAIEIPKPVIEATHAVEIKKEEPVHVAEHKKEPTKPAVEESPLSPQPTPIPAVVQETKPVVKEAAPEQGRATSPQKTPEPTREEILKMWDTLTKKQAQEEAALREKHRKEKEEFKKKFAIDPEQKVVSRPAQQVPVQQTATQQPSVISTPSQQPQPVQKPIVPPLTIATNKIADLESKIFQELTPRTATAVAPKNVQSALPQPSKETTQLQGTGVKNPIAQDSSSQGVLQNGSAVQQNGVQNGTPVTQKPASQAPAPNGGTLQQTKSTSTLNPASVPKLAPTKSTPVLNGTPSPAPRKHEDELHDMIMQNLISLGSATPSPQPTSTGSPSNVNAKQGSAPAPMTASTVPTAAPGVTVMNQVPLQNGGVRPATAIPLNKTAAIAQPVPTSTVPVAPLKSATATLLDGLSSAQPIQSAQHQPMMNGTLKPKTDLIDDLLSTT